jgi:hypothetical protein
MLGSHHHMKYANLMVVAFEMLVWGLTKPYWFTKRVKYPVICHETGADRQKPVPTKAPFFY